jgi:hypothetical protein
MQLEEFQQKVSDLLSQMEFESEREVTQLASYLAACSSSVVSQINEVYNETGIFPADANYVENMANLDTLVFALGVDIVDLPQERLRKALIALQCRITRKSLIGSVDRIAVVDCMLGMLTGYVMGVLIAAQSDDLENMERWQKAGDMLRKDIYALIVTEMRKHKPEIGELN